jgi:hypothetical protein
VVITQPDFFIAQIRDTISAKLPGWTFVAESVEYFDPFFARPHQMAAQLFKHFRYSYQKEFRLLWVPPCPEHAARDFPSITSHSKLAP